MIMLESARMHIEIGLVEIRILYLNYKNQIGAWKNYSHQHQ